MSPADPAHLRRTFDTAAERYDRVRPSYPKEVLDDLAALAELGTGSRILEIGCGTGQATLPLAKRGYSIVAVELGAHLAAIARRRLKAHPNVEVVVAPFEGWPIPADRFDAVVSANAFHWIDPTVRVKKASAALRPGGSLAVIETRRLPIAHEAVLAALRRCHQRWTSSAPAFRAETMGDPPANTAEVDASGLFDRAASRRYASSQEYTADEYRDLLLTFSQVLALEPQPQSGLVACIGEVVDRELGGRMSERLFNTLLVARKR
jgi:SAM-dependent methyltransferase